jgi:hypothetical protein
MPPKTTRVVSTARQEQGRQLAASLSRDPVTHRFLKRTPAPPTGEPDAPPAPPPDPSSPGRRWDPRTQRRRPG